MITSVSRAPTGPPPRCSDPINVGLLSAKGFRELVEVLRVRNESFFVIELRPALCEHAQQLFVELQKSGGRDWSVGWLGHNRIGILGQDTQSAESVQRWLVDQTSAAQILRVFLHHDGNENRAEQQKDKLPPPRNIRDRDRGLLSCFEDNASSPQRTMVQTRRRPRKRKTVNNAFGDGHADQRYAFSFGKKSEPIYNLYKIPTPIGKRCFDIAFGILGLFLASPLLCLAAALIKITSPGPLFFVQHRVGHGGQSFRMYKFRTMHADADRSKAQLVDKNEMNGSAFKVRCDPRVTSVGIWLRRFSIDEIPQIWNVIRGDMSLVGPRPLPTEDWTPASVRELYRHDVVPGLTCIWQIMGRNEIAWEDWVRMDLFYVRRRCWVLDARILLATVPAVLSQRGAY